MQKIHFRDTTTNLTQKREAIKIGKYLAVTQEAEIFKINTGKKLFESNFKDYWEALDVAEWLDDLYGKYFPLWEKWENVDVFRLARHSVKNGNKILNIIEKIKYGELTTFEEIENEYTR